MAIIGLGILATLLGFLVHLAIWRIARPRRSGAALIAIFVVSTFATMALAAALWAVAPPLRGWLPGTLAQWLQATILSLTAGAAYVMTYPAVEVESPVLILSEMFDAAGAAGVARTDVYARYDDSVLVLPRLRDLLDEQLAENFGDRYCLTSRGHRLAQIFIAWRNLLGLDKGG